MLGGPAAQRVACSKRAAAQAHTDVHVHAHAHVYTKARAHMNTHTCPRTPLSPPPHDSPVQARASGCCALCQGTPLHALTARAPLSSGRHAGAAGPGSVRWWRAWRGGRGRWARPRGGALGPGPHSTPHPRQMGWGHPVVKIRKKVSLSHSSVCRCHSFSCGSRLCPLKNKTTRNYSAYQLALTAPPGSIWTPGTMAPTAPTGITG